MDFPGDKTFAELLSGPPPQVELNQPEEWGCWIGDWGRGSGAAERSDDSKSDNWRTPEVDSITPYLLPSTALHCHHSHHPCSPYCDQQHREYHFHSICELSSDQTKLNHNRVLSKQMQSPSQTEISGFEQSCACFSSDANEERHESSSDSDSVMRKLNKRRESYFRSRIYSQHWEQATQYTYVLYTFVYECV